MPEAVKFVAFIPSHQSEKSGKLVPAKAKDGNDREFTIPEKWADFVSSHQGQTVEIEFTESQNGKWTNRNLTSVKLPEPPKTQPTGNGGSWKRDPEEGKLIIRQSCLKAAVDFASTATTEQSYKHVLWVADQFVAWVHGEVAVNADEPVATAAPSPQPKGRLTTYLREGESLPQAAARAVKEHDDSDILESALRAIPPADAVEEVAPSTRTLYPSRETLRPSRSAVR